MREIGSDKDSHSRMTCEKVDDQLENISAMTMSSNRQCLAVACRFRVDKSAYIFFYDTSQSKGIKKLPKMIHEGSPTDNESKYFICVGFSPEAKQLVALTNRQDGNVKIYEWKKEVRTIAATSWLTELKKEGKEKDKEGNDVENVEINKVSLDPSNKDQVWMSGKFHARMWRNQGGVLKPSPKIPGLEQDKCYTDHAWAENNSIVFGTDKGELFFVHDGRQCFSKASAFNTVVESISCIYPYYRGLIIGGENGQLALWEKKEQTDKDEKTKVDFKFERPISIISSGLILVEVDYKWKIVAMCLSSKTKADQLAIAYHSNFICILKLSDVLEKKYKEHETQDVEVYYIDEGYHWGRAADEPESRFHSLVMDMDIAVHRPLIATCSKNDSTLRIWNYVTMKCEMVKYLTLQHTSRPAEPVKPLSIAFHPSGYILAGGFDSQAIIWHLLLDGLRQFHVFPHYKHCTKLKFSNGGQYLAIAQMVQTQKCVFIHNTYTLKKIHTIKVPSNAMVCDIVFSENDSLISLCCTDGFLIVSNIIERTETMSHSKRKWVYTTCVIKEANDVIAFGADESKSGVIRRILREDLAERIGTCDSKIMHGQLVAPDCLIVGTENGMIKLFDNIVGPKGEYMESKAYGELNMHAGPISKILVSPNSRYVFSCGEDGAIFVYALSVKGGQTEEVKGDEVTTLAMTEGLAGVVLVERDKIKAEQKSLEELNTKVKELENDMIAREKQSTQQWADNAKALEDEKKKALAELEGRLNSLKEELSKKEQQHTEAMKKLEGNHVASVSDLEAIFKAKIDRERKNYMNLEQNMKEVVQSLRDELEKRERDKEKELLDEHMRYEKDLEKLNRKIKDVKESQSKAERRYEDKLTLQEDEHDKEMDRREMDLNKEISALKNLIKSKDEEINKLVSLNNELTDKMKDLNQINIQQQSDIEVLQKQRLEHQGEVDKARKEKEASIAEMNELKISVLTLKAKHKEGIKNKQVLVGVAKNLREKMSPVVDENTYLKTKMKGIEEEYNIHTKLMEDLKTTIENQESIIAQLRETDKKRELIIKKCDEKVDHIAQQLYRFKERQKFDKKAYSELFQSLYLEYVEKVEDRFRENPEIVGELGRRIQYLQESKASVEENNHRKLEQLDKECKKLTKDNSDLIRDINVLQKRLQETTKQKQGLEGKLKSAGILCTASGEQITRKGMSMTVKLSRMQEGEPAEADQMRSTGMQPRPFTTKRKERIAKVGIEKSGKLAKGSTQHFAQFRPAENERIAELTVFWMVQIE